MERFLIPAYYHGQVFTEGELINPKGGVLADAEKANGDMLGMVKLVSGCLASVTDSNGEVMSSRDKIEGIVRNMPYQAAEYLAMKIIAKRTDGAIEQIVKCPRCKEQYIFEYIDEAIDNRIFFDQMDVIRYEDVLVAPEISIELESPIEIKTRQGEIIQTVRSFRMRFPTMNDGIAAEMSAGNDGVRRQYKMYISAITHINGEETDLKFKNTWGMFIFDRMDSDDIRKISDGLKDYGIVKTHEHTCKSCGKQFKFVVDVSGFFG